jgi:DNA-binding SARP family transcriptional activator
VTHLKAGDVLEAMGELDRAREHFRKGMEISERLVDLDPYNGTWNWDLFRAYQRMASSTPPGTEWHRKALAAIEKMDEEGLLAADNRQWIGITRERLEASLTKTAK